MTLNRAHPLCRELKFACPPGWTFGFTSGTVQTDYDDFTMSRGVFNTTVPNASPWLSGLDCGGRGIDNGDGSFTSVPEYLVPTGSTRYDVAAGWSAAVLVRPDILSADTLIPIFKRRNQPYGATDAGWHFSAGAGNTYRIAFSNGVNERTATSTTTQNAANMRGDLLVATLNAAGTSLKLYVNGVLEATTTFAATAMGNPAGTPIKFLGLGTAGAGQPAYSGLVSMGMVWERELNASDVAKLYSDPFAAWRQNEDEFGNDFTVILNDKRWQMKMPRPFPRRGHSLWRGCKHASAPWLNGFEATAGQGDYDDVTGTRALYQGNIPTGASGFVNQNYGRAVQNSLTANSVMKFPDSLARYDLTSPSWSAAVLIRPRSLQSDDTVPIYKRRSTLYTPDKPGWNFTAGAGNLWKVEISNGTVEVSLSSARVMDTTRIDLLIARYNGAVLELFVNGVLEDSINTTIGPINAPSGQTINFLGVGASSAEFDGIVGMGAFWDRPLTNGDISTLNVDPFRMWRPAPDDELGNFEGGAYQTYFLVF